MKKSSLKKALFAAAACGAVIFAIVWFGSDPQTPQRTITGVAPEDRPPDLAEGTEVPPGLDPSGIALSESTTVQRTNPETGELEQEFFYEQLTPQEEGVFDIVRPQARLYVSPTQVIHMRSDAGRFVAPDNHPQTGQFRDNVVITLYQSSEGERLDLSRQSPHRVLRIELDEAEFDTVLGEIRSDSELHVTTPATGQAEFAGRGLTLLYHELERRIEYMQINHGRSLRFRPAAQADEDAADTVPDPDETDAEDDPSPDDAPDPTSPAQFYRLVFEDAVTAVHDGNRISADTLVAYFSLDRPSPGSAGARATDRSSNPSPPLAGERQSEGAPRSGAPTSSGLQENTSPPHPTHAHAPRLAAAPGGDLALAYAIDSAQPGLDDVLDENEFPDELVMTWTGPMVMVPADGTPPQLQNAEDVFLQFDGGPVAVELADGEQLTCARLTYSESARQLDAFGSSTGPVRLAAPALGEIHAPQLTVNLDENTARLAGPGSIRTHAIAHDDNPDDADDADDTPRTLPPNFAADWSDHLQITFAADEDNDGPAHIESARFVGDVRVRDDDFDLRSHTLAAAFAPRGEAGEQVDLQQVEADGDVQVTLADDGAISANWLRIETAPDDTGRRQPSVLLAEGDVDVRDAHQQIQAGRLAVALAAAEEAPAAEDDDDDPADDASADDRPAALSGIAVRQLEAHDNVRLTLDDAMVARGDYIAADTERREARLRGEPVVLSRYVEGQHREADAEPLTELRVTELFLEDEGRFAYADGAGSFAYRELRDADADDPDQPQQQRVTVTWSDRMQYDDATQTIEVEGDVVAEAEQSPVETNRLTADRKLTLTLVEPEVLAAARGEEVDEADEASEPDADDPLHALGGGRSLHRLTAEGDAVLLGTRWADADRRRVLTRFRASGDELTFDNLESVARIAGAGSLLLEDYRPTDDEAADEAAADADEAADEPQPSSTAAAPLSGRGATVFTWTDELRINEAEADMRMAGDIRMTHRPAGRDDVVELFTDALVADMATLEGLDALNMSDADATQINHIAATGSVRLRDAKRMITADQLFYDGPSHTVLLRTDVAGRPVQVIDFDEPRPLRAAEILWHLETDTLEILEAGF